MAGRNEPYDVSAVETHAPVMHWQGGAMKLVRGSDRIRAEDGVSPVEGHVRWAPVKSLWIGGMTFATLVFGSPYATWDAVALFVVSSGVTLCLGHSVGMHRRLIHRSFECPKWLEYLAVYAGTLVGMAGPIGMIRLHDFRDWAQRQSACHDYFCHRRDFWHDAWWQLHCELVLTNPPIFRLEPDLENDRVYSVLERTWMWQQLPWALLFLALGGWGWVIWGICARVAVCVTGHWLVGHFAHRDGDQTWIVEGAAAQGYNVRFAGLISMGESWHNNHHAFPGSAKLGLLPGQTDLGWLLIKSFAAVGLASGIKTPNMLPHREALKLLPETAGRAPSLVLRPRLWAR
jgi:stearoyl-CoA desaturase (delta-9 desaturase)